MPERRQRVRVTIRVGRDPKAYEAPASPEPSLKQRISERRWTLIGAIAIVLLFWAVVRSNNNLRAPSARPQQAAQVVAPTATRTPRGPTSTPKPTYTPTLTPTPTVTPTPLFAQWTDVSKWSVRLHNVDDLASVYVNSHLISTVERQRDSGWLDVSEYIIPETKNYIRFVTWNESEEYAWGYQLKVDDTIVWEDKAGEIGLRGANNNDISRVRQTIYDKTLMINDTGQLTLLQPSSHKWTVRLDNIEDRGEIYLNAHALAASSDDDGGDTDWLDISDKIVDGREHMLGFKIVNRFGAASWSMVLQRDGKTVWNDQKSLREADQGLIHDAFVYINSQGEVSSVPENTRWHVRIPTHTNVYSDLSINGEPFLSVRNYSMNSSKTDTIDRGWIELTDMLRPGEINYLHFRSIGKSANMLYDFRLLRNSAVVWENAADIRFKYGDNWSAYDYLIAILPDGELSADPPTPRWYVMFFSTNEHGGAYLNGIKVEGSLIHDDVWVDITADLLTSQDNTIRFTSDSVDHKWHGSLKRNNSIVWESVDGQPEKVVTITADGEFVAPP